MNDGIIHDFLAVARALTCFIFKLAGEFCQITAHTWLAKSVSTCDLNYLQISDVEAGAQYSCYHELGRTEGMN